MPEGITETRRIDGKLYRLTWTTTRTLDPSVTPIIQALTVCFDPDGSKSGHGEPGRVLFLRKPNGRYGLPGGHLEPGETPDMTARREVMEEVTVEIGAPCLLGHQHVIHLSDSVPPYYQLRYAAMITSVLPPAVDPASGILFERAWFPLRELNAILGWERAGDELQKAAERWWRERT